MIKNLKSIFFRLVGATAAMLSLCYAFKTVEPKKSKIVFTTQFSGKFLNHLYLMGMTEESGMRCRVDSIPKQHGAC